MTYYHLRISFKLIEDLNSNKIKMIMKIKKSDITNSRKLSGVATGGAIVPPGSILTLKKYTFSCVAINAKSFFWTENLRFRNCCPPLEGFASPGNFPSYATACSCRLVQRGFSKIITDVNVSPAVYQKKCRLRLQV